MNWWDAVTTGVVTASCAVIVILVVRGQRTMVATEDASTKPPVGQLSTVIAQLTHARTKQQRLAVVFGAVALVTAFGGVAFLTWQAARSYSHITDAVRRGDGDTAITAQTAYLIIRGTGLAALVGGIVYFLLSLARSSIDQATRYEKRLIASHLIDYALHEEGVNAKKLAAAHKIVEVWGSTVESAYTPPRVARSVGRFKVGVSRDGASIDASPNQP